MKRVNTVRNEQPCDVHCGSVLMGASRHGSNDNYVAIKSSDFQQIMDRLTALEQNHNNQANQISTLTSKCQMLQSHIDAATKVSSSCGSSTLRQQYNDTLSANDTSTQQSIDYSVQQQPISSHTVPSTMQSQGLPMMPALNMPLPSQINDYRYNCSEYAMFSSPNNNDNVSCNPMEFMNDSGNHGSHPFMTTSVSSPNSTNLSLMSSQILMNFGNK